MKLSSKILKLGMLMLLVTVILAGCASASSAHLGKWEVYEGDDDNLEFTEEKMYSSNGFSYPYEIDGEKLNVQMASITRTYGLSVTGNQMELHDEYTGITSKYIRKGSFVHDAEAYKSLVGSWGIDDKVIFIFTKNQELSSPADDEAMNIEVQDGLIRSSKDDEVMYVPYAIDGETLKLTITGDEVEAVKFTQEYLDELAKKKEEERKAEEARLAEEEANRVRMDLTVDDFYFAENYVFTDITMTNNMDKSIMVSKGKAVLLTDTHERVGVNTDDDSFMKIEAGESARACLGFMLETDADWDNSSKITYLMFYDENEEEAIAAANVDGSNFADNATESVSTPEILATSDCGLVLVELEPALSDVGTKMLKGKIENPTNDDIKFAEIRFEIYDEDGSVIDTTYSSIDRIKAGGSWKFESYLDDEAYDLDLLSFTGQK